MTDLIQTFELWLERKINDTIKSYLENNPASGDINDDRIRELAREEAIDAIEGASYDVDISVSA